MDVDYKTKIIKLTEALNRVKECCPHPEKEIEILDVTKKFISSNGDVREEPTWWQKCKVCGDIVGLWRGN